MDIILIGLIAANVIFSYLGFQDQSFFRKYDFHICSIRAGEQVRMLSSAFLHVDIPHLVFNMLTLYFFAPVVTDYLGIFSFLLIYFGSLACASMLTLYMHRDEYGYRAVGASGAVTGILYSAILIQPNMGIYMFFIPIPIPAYIFGIVYLLFSIYGMRTRLGNIGHTAHFGGAVGGYVLTLVKAPQLFSEDPLMTLLLAIPIVLLLILERRGKI
jgi:membrane associated rhomboid family serine protease